MKQNTNKTLENPLTIFYYKNKKYNLPPYSLPLSIVTHTFFTREGSPKKTPI
jgi:hypothetical protein